MSKPSSRWWLTQDSEQTFVAAPVGCIYDLLADMPRMGEWSPECPTGRMDRRECSPGGGRSVRRP
jgi:hypothetical protein